MATLTQPPRNTDRGSDFPLRGRPSRRAPESGSEQGNSADVASILAERNRSLERQNRELRLNVLRLERLVYVDGLTGLANRRCFDTALGAEIRRAARDAAPLSLVLCDVDLFKRCNDTFGHAAGDVVLTKLGEILRAFCRRAGDVAARYGGEEFALLLPRVGTSDAIHIGEMLRRNVASVSIRGAHSMGPERITVSVGVTAFHAVTPCQPRDMLCSADAALYRAKANGRNRTVYQAIERKSRVRR